MVRVTCRISNRNGHDKFVGSSIVSKKVILKRCAMDVCWVPWCLIETLGTHNAQAPPRNGARTIKLLHREAWRPEDRWNPGRWVRHRAPRTCAPWLKSSHFVRLVPWDSPQETSTSWSPSGDLEGGIHPSSGNHSYLRRVFPVSSFATLHPANSTRSIFRDGRSFEKKERTYNNN
jgi:hypothetical protein